MEELSITRCVAWTYKQNIRGRSWLRPLLSGAGISGILSQVSSLQLSESWESLRFSEPHSFLLTKPGIGIVLTKGCFSIPI